MAAAEHNKYSYRDFFFFVLQRTMLEFENTREDREKKNMYERVERSSIGSQLITFNYRIHILYKFIAFDSSIK